MKILVEDKFGHGAVKINPIRRKLRKLFRPKVAGGVPFDWTKGYSVLDTIGVISIKNQGTSDSCGGQSGAYFLEIQRRLRKIQEGAISAKSIYAPIAYIGGGTTIPRLEQELCTVGAALEASVSSYDALGQPLSESMMIEQSWVTPAVKSDMLTRAGYTPYDCADDIDTVAAAVQSYGAVLLEIGGSNNGSWLSYRPMPPATIEWRHFLCAVGAKMIDGKKAIIVANSWGTTVGEGGFQALTEDYFNGGGVIDAFCLIPDQYILSLPPSMGVWQSVLNFFRALWKLPIIKTT